MISLEINKIITSGINKNSDVVFINSNPSYIDVIRNKNFCGEVGKVFKKEYLDVLGLNFDDISIVNLVPEFVGDNGKSVEPCNDDISKYYDYVIENIKENKIVIGLGQKVKKELGEKLDFVLPHPFSILKYGNNGEISRKSVFIKKEIENIKENKVDIKVNKFIKKEEEKKLVYGVVLEPDSVDLQGDIISVEEIEKSAHNYMINSRMVGYRHNSIADARVVESYIFNIENQEIVKGSWIIVVKVMNYDLWEKVKNNEINGFSIGGYGNRVKII